MQNNLQPSLTVLMPVYNGERFLRNAVESILQQTFTDFEFLIIDDCSTDASRSIIRSYEDPRITVVCNETNLGIAASLNKGIQMASCEIIARMDADDISYPERLEKQYAFMKLHEDCALLSCYARVITENGEVIRQEIQRDKFLYYSLHFECNIYHPSVVFRRQPVIDVNMYDIPYAEDFDLFWKLASRFRIRQLEEVLLDYRISQESTHFVRKRTEYDQSILQVVRRNINYHFDKPLQLPPEYIQFLRYEFDAVIAAGGFSELLKCMVLLKKVSEKIIGHANPNNIGKNTRLAFENKKYYTLLYLNPFLSRVKWTWLCLLSGNAGIFYSIVQKKIKRRYNWVFSKRFYKERGWFK